MTWLLDFLRGFVPAFIKAWLKDRAEIRQRQNKGAADQRQADKDADAAITDDAARATEEIRDAPDDDVRGRLDRWRTGGSV